MEASEIKSWRLGDDERRGAYELNICFIVLLTITAKGRISQRTALGHVAKVGVVGSNPIARSSFSQENQHLVVMSPSGGSRNFYSITHRVPTRGNLAHARQVGIALAGLGEDADGAGELGASILSRTAARQSI
ncbi:hypothetical protein [Xanthobacter oligotrophicus]|uniref:hypothetical protein n=1 Tax=Xanthobacter oligotrophicus TaxID=2607286 RepID=UPI0011F0F974|nr:hypothetical protein [Xanthobacter oligotrophicus]MCG5238053.1 hypothetical protein [Xanthobacter oligotrophicus]